MTSRSLSDRPALTTHPLSAKAKATVVLAVLVCLNLTVWGAKQLLG